MSTKRKAPMTLARPVVKQSAKMPTKPRVDETMTAVSTEGSIHQTLNPKVDAIEISSDSSSDYDELSDGEEAASGGEDGDRETAPASKPIPGQTTPPPDDAADRKPRRDAADVDADVEMQDDRPSASASDDEATSPTFGDLIRGSNTTTTVVNVPATSLSLNRRAGTPLSPSASQQPPTQSSASLAIMAPARPAAPPPTLSSLGTVLNQALRTDDAVLLESCLHTSDLPTVRATIQRMDSALASTLLSKIAARMHRRPARAHSLMAWVQWTLVAHGGGLAAQPDLVRDLAELSRVLEERARALPSLLVLKGKLDMLDSQMQLRRDNLGGARGRAEDEYEGDEEDDDEEEGVVYVEGDEEDEGKHARLGMSNGGPRARGGDDDDDELVLANGIGGETDDDDSEDGEGSMSGMDVDDDEVASQGSLDESEVDFDDVEESEDETDGDVAAPPTKMQKVGRAARK